MSNSGLIVRRSERFEISIPAKVRVAMAHIDQVQFIKGVGDDHRWINIDIVDFGEGGVGFVSEVFFARGLALEVQIPELGNPGGDIWVDCEMSVKRIQMTDRRPAYLVGCAFGDLSDENKESISMMIERLLGNIDGNENNVGGHHA